MIKLKHTKGLYLDQARYFFDDANGSKVQVDIDYMNNFYRTKKIKGNGEYKSLEREAEEFARSLLQNKAQKNIALKYT